MASNSAPVPASEGSSNSTKTAAVVLGVLGIAAAGAYLLTKSTPKVEPAETKPKKKKGDKKKKKKSDKPTSPTASTSSSVPSTPTTPAPSTAAAAAAKPATSSASSIAISSTSTTTSTKPKSDEVVGAVESKVEDQGLMTFKLAKKPSSYPSSPQEIVSRVENSMDEFMQTRAVSKADGTILEWLRATPPDTFRPQERMMAAQWLMQYYSLSSQSVRDEHDFKAIVSAQKADLPLIWSLLYFSTPPPLADLPEEEARVADTLLVDVATRMQVPEKLGFAFDRLLNKPIDELAQEEIVMLFTTAPLLGRWATFRDLGAAIIKFKRSLKFFHETAMERPDIPDYATLYDQSAALAKLPNVNPSDLLWRAFILEKVEMWAKPDGLKAEDPDVLKVFTGDFKDAHAALGDDEEETSAGRDMPLESGQHRLIRTGAYARMISTSMIPLSLTGPATANTIELHGYMDMPIDENSSYADRKARQAETYSLKRLPAKCTATKSVWIGSYSMSHVSPDTKQNLSMAFKVRVVLAEDTLGLM